MNIPYNIKRETNPRGDVIETRTYRYGQDELVLTDEWASQGEQSLYDAVNNILHTVSTTENAPTRIIPSNTTRDHIFTGQLADESMTTPYTHDAFSMPYMDTNEEVLEQLKETVEEIKIRY